MIHIVCCTDENYAFNFTVIAQSVLAHHRNDDVKFYLLHSPLSTLTLQKIDSYVAEKDLSLSKYLLDASVFAGLPEIGYFTIAMYYRLMIPELLPSDIPKVLYLDMDVIVEGRLDELWNQDLSGKAAAVVEDGAPKHLGQYSPERYFNSGVMLMNLEYWRARNVKQKAIDFMTAHQDILKFPDQDALNVVLQHDVLFQDQKWNYHLNLDKKFLKQALKRKVPAAKAPVLIHFNQKVKPWMYHCKHPYRSRYWALLRETTFKDYKMKNKTLANVLFYYTPKPLRALVWPKLVRALPQN